MNESLVFFVVVARESLSLNNNCLSLQFFSSLHSLVARRTQGLDHIMCRERKVHLSSRNAVVLGYTTLS